MHGFISSTFQQNNGSHKNTPTESASGKIDINENKGRHNLSSSKIITQNCKQLIAEHCNRDLKVLGCIIVEIFLAPKIRPLSGLCLQSFEKRFEVCSNVLKNNLDLLPKCVQYPAMLLLNSDANEMITEKGLPLPSAHQLLQPLLNNMLFPFPINFGKAYNLIKSMVQFDSTSKLLELVTVIEGDDDPHFEVKEKRRMAFHRKTAACKVKTCVTQIMDLLEPTAYEQFNVIEIILPHITDMLANGETGILVAWYLFDDLAAALGPKLSCEYLLDPILHLYETDEEHFNFLHSFNCDFSMKFTSSTSSSLKSMKAVKLYHHSFLQRLIIRFGLKKFLENFISPLIEAVGGYKELVDVEHNASAKRFELVETNTFDEESLEKMDSDSKVGEEEMFTFDGEMDSNKVANLDESNNSDNIMKIMDQFDISSEGWC